MQHLSYVDHDECNGPDLDGDWADVALNVSTYHAEVATGKDKANTTPAVVLKYWPDG